MDLNELIGQGLLLKWVAAKLGEAHITNVQLQGQLQILQAENNRLTDELQKAQKKESGNG